MLAALVPEDRQPDVNAHLDELGELFEGRERAKNEKEKPADRRSAPSTQSRRKPKIRAGRRPTE